MRSMVVLAIAVVGIIALMVWGRSPAPDIETQPSLMPMITAHQQGIVGYRDPAGAISPDGRWLAYTEGRYVRVVPVAGGVEAATSAGQGQIRYVTWITSTRYLFEDTATPERWWTGDLGGTQQPLWTADTITGRGGQPTSVSVRTSALRQLTASRDGAWLAGVANDRDGAQLWKISIDGSRAEMRAIEGRPSWPAFMPTGDIACVVVVQGRSRIAAPCGQAPIVPAPDIDAVGPVALSPDGARIYFAASNGRGTVNLWAMTRATGAAERLTAFARDAYAPTVAANGTVVFKTQTYRACLAELADGRVRQLTSFQSETPFWHPREPLLSMTYGSWRRVLDDAQYPDIAQEIGVIDASATGIADKPLRVVADSPSEDQAMAWSPNGAWIAFHSHREMSDDVWLRPADGSSPDRRITTLGRGAEVGWPRWSPDGTKVLLDGANRDGRSVAYTIGVDQDTGQVTAPLTEIPTPGYTSDLMHAEWMPDGRAILAVAKAGPGRHEIVRVPAGGGTPERLLAFASEHDFPGLTVHPDGKSFVFVSPAPDGVYQLWLRDLTGGSLRQLTTDPTNKTQPAFSPDGRRLAFTVWSYDVSFLMFTP